MKLNDKKLELVVKDAIKVYGSEAAANKLRREANLYRSQSQAVLAEGLDPQELDAYLLAAADKIEQMLRERKR